VGFKIAFPGQGVGGHGVDDHAVEVEDESEFGIHVII
jgi:hypothetical protein